MDNANLLNVAISRAENKLIIVVSDNEELLTNSNIGDLIRYIEYNNLEIINSNIYSIFDLLYSSYSEKLLEFLKKHKKVSKYNSENLMNALIEKVLDYDEFKSLGKVLHYPLNMLIRDTSKLDEKELKYATFDISLSLDVGYSTADELIKSYGNIIDLDLDIFWYELIFSVYNARDNK